MELKKNQYYFASFKLDSKLLEQFFFYMDTTCYSKKVKLTIDLLFNNFTYLNIKLLICCLFVLDQFLGDNNFSLKISKYRIKREKHTALIIRWTVDDFISVQNLFSTTFPKIVGNRVFIPRSNDVRNNLLVDFKGILSFFPYIKNSRVFYKFFENGYALIFFSFQILHLKHNLILKNHLSYLGFLTF